MFFHSEKSLENRKTSLQTKIRILEGTVGTVVKRQWSVKHEHSEKRVKIY